MPAGVREMKNNLSALLRMSEARSTTGLGGVEGFFCGVGLADVREGVAGVREGVAGVRGSGLSSIEAREGKGLESSESTRVTGCVELEVSWGGEVRLGFSNQISLYCSMLRWRLSGLGRGAKLLLRYRKSGLSTGVQGRIPGGTGDNTQPG